MDFRILALWFSNYSSLAGKNLRPKLAGRLGEVSQSLLSKVHEQELGTGLVDDKAQVLTKLDALIKDCIATGYPNVKVNAGDNRGALRAFTWGSKVATILKSIVGRLISKGEAVLGEGQSFYVCDGCGFIYIGLEAPAICPVCKAPASRFAAY